MDLHPHEALTHLVVVHRRALGLVHGYLESAVPEAFSRWEDVHPFPVDLSGTTLSTTVRELLWTAADSRAMRESSLSVTPTPNRSARLVAADGVRIRVRKRPTSFKTGQPLRCPKSDQVALFGSNFDDLTYEFAILWEPSLLHADLKEAVLAAVANLDDSGSTVIYAETLLPPPIADTEGQVDLLAVANRGPTDDFEEFLGAAEEPGDPGA